MPNGRAFESFRFSTAHVVLCPIVSILSSSAIDVIAMDETQVKVLLQDAEEHLKVLSCRSSNRFFDVRLPDDRRTSPPQRKDRAA